MQQHESLAYNRTQSGTPGWIWLFGFTTVLILALLPFSTYVAAVPMIIEEWEMSNTQTGLVFSAFLVGYVVSSLLVVPLTDRFPGQSILLACSVAASTGSLLFPLLAQEPISAALIRVLYGAGVVGIYVPGTRIVSEQFAGPNRGKAVGLYVTGFYLATSLSLIFSGALLGQFSWRFSYWILAIASAIGPILAYALLKKINTPDPRTSRSTPGLKLRVLRNRAARLMMLGYSLHAWELYLMRMWFAPFLVAVLISNGYNQEVASTLGSTTAGFIMAIGAIGPFLGGMLSDRIGRTATASLIFSISGLCSFGLGWMLEAPWLMVLGVGLVYSFFVGFDSSVYTTAVTELADPRSLGSALALHSFLGFGAGMISPIVFGIIQDATGPAHGWGWGFATGGVAAVGAVAAMLVLRSMPESKSMANGKR